MIAQASIPSPPTASGNPSRIPDAPAGPPSNATPPPTQPERPSLRATAPSPPAPATPDDPVRALFDAATDLVAGLDPTGKVRFANRAFHHAVGVENSPLEGHSFYDVVHHYDHAALQAWLARHAAGDPAATAHRIRLVLRAADGHDLPVEATATQVRGADGRVTSLNLLLVDLTERERDAHARQETAELFQLLSQHAPWGVFITDAAGRLRFANRHWRSIADVLHVPDPRGVWWQMVHPGDRDRVLAQWQGALAGNHEFCTEYRVNAPLAEPRWVRTRIAQSWAGDGRRGACVGITEDITLKRQADDVLRKAHEALEDQVRSRTEELHETNRELTSLIYAITHDLKAPLRGINRLADWLAEDHAAQLPAEGSALIVKMQARVRQLHALIDGMLAYSRIGRTNDQELSVDLNTVVADITRLLDPPPTFSVLVPEPLPTVTGVPHQLHQLLQNLIDNAIKFTDKPRGRIQITCRRAGPAWEVTAADNGPGIPARFHEKIFSLFQRLDVDPDRPGAGIGLALVKRIVETRGGRIAVASEEGHGTTFHFTWPDTPRRANRR